MILRVSFAAKLVVFVVVVSFFSMPSQSFSQAIEKVQHGSFELTPVQMQMMVKSRLADVFILGHPRNTSESLGFGPCAWMTYNDTAPVLGVSKWYNINGGSVDLIDTMFIGAPVIVASDGQNVIDLIGTPGLGALNQNIATEAGRSYIVSFDISSNQQDGNLQGAFSFFWNGQLPPVVDAATAPTQNIYDKFTFVLQANSNVTPIGFAGIPTGDDGGFFGAILDNVSAIEIRTAGDATSLDENYPFSSFRLNVLANDSGITEVKSAEVVGCSSNLTLDQCGFVIQDGFPGGQVFWDAVGPDPLAFDFLAEGETATIEIEYETCTVVAIGRNGTEGPSAPVSDTATWTITVNGTNDVPVAVADSVDTTLNFPIDILVAANDTDIDGTADGIPVIVTNAINGTVVAGVGGVVTYTPNPGFSGNDSFTYRATDNNGGLSTNAVAVNIRIWLGDVNQDGVVNLLDVGPFVDLLSSGEFQVEADINRDGAVNLLDVALFVDLLAG